MPNISISENVMNVLACSISRAFDTHLCKRLIIVNFDLS